MHAVLKASVGVAVLLPASGTMAYAQDCPPNSHPIIIAIPGNLRTAHCWCNDGYQNLGGVCVRTEQPPAAPSAPTWPPPSGGSMNPVR